MKESINTAIVVTIVVVIIGLIEVILFASFAYSKAYKVKNRIVDIIEENVDDNGDYVSNLFDIIDEEIAKIGYQVTSMGINDCPVLSDDAELQNSNSNYRYCVYKIVQPNTNKGNGTYYTVISYMHFDTPLISFNIPIKGSTKTVFNYEGR